jgi:hypothetical protein
MPSGSQSRNLRSNSNNHKFLRFTSRCNDAEARICAPMETPPNLAGASRYLREL